MGSSDWAAWVQAVGSIAAIVASTELWRRDKARQRKQVEREQNERDERRFSADYRLGIAINPLLLSIQVILDPVTALGAAATTEPHEGEPRKDFRIDLFEELKGFATRTDGCTLAYEIAILATISWAERFVHHWGRSMIVLGGKVTGEMRFLLQKQEWHAASTCLTHLTTQLLSAIEQSHETRETLAKKGS